MFCAACFNWTDLNCINFLRFLSVSWSWVLQAWWNCHVQKSGTITKSCENRTSTSSLSWGLFHLSTCDSRGAIFIVGVVLWYKCALIYLKYIRKLRLTLHYWGRPHGEPCAIDSKSTEKKIFAEICMTCVHVFWRMDGLDFLVLQRNTKCLHKYTYSQCFQSVASRFQCLTTGIENHPHLKIQGNRCFTVTLCPHIHFQSACFLNFLCPKEKNDWENQTDNQKCRFLNSHSILLFALLGIEPSPLRFVQVHFKWA